MRAVSHASAGTARQSTPDGHRVEFTFSKAWLATKRFANDVCGPVASSRYHPPAAGDAAS